LLNHFGTQVNLELSCTEICRIVLFGKITTMVRKLQQHAIWLSLVWAILPVTNLQAETLLGSLSFAPYIGAEFQYQHIKANTDWRKFLPANFNNSAVFVGNKYHENFGFEIGYFHTLKKAVSSANISQFNGAAANGSTIVIAEMRNKGFSLEWDVYYPIDAQFNVMASFGFVTMHPNLEINATSSTNLGSALNKVKGRNKTIFRPGIGVEYLEKNWGARGRLLWDDTQKLYLNTDRVGATFFNALTPKAFKQTMTFTFGVFYRF